MERLIKYSSFAVLLGILVTSTTPAFSASPPGRVIWEGTENGKILVITSLGVFKNGKFTKAEWLDDTDKCRYGMTDFPDRRSVYMPTERTKSREWERALGDLDFVECRGIRTSYSYQYDVKRADILAQKSEQNFEFNGKVKSSLVKQNAVKDGGFVTEGDFGSNRPELRLIEYELGAQRGEAIIAYTKNELKRRSATRKVPAIFGRDLCWVFQNDHQSNWSISCNNGKKGAGRFTGVDQRGSVSGRGTFDGIAFNFIHRKCHLPWSCKQLLGELLANVEISTSAQLASSSSNQDQPLNHLIASLPDTELCEQATIKINGELQWADASYLYWYVEEAKRRRLICGVGVASEIAQSKIDGLTEFKLGKMDSASLCKYAMGVWSSNSFTQKQAAIYAESNRINCQPLSSPVKVDSEESERVRILEQRLAQLEAEKTTKQDSIAQDTQIPTIRITSTDSDGARGTISGTATDNTGIAEVLVDGQAVAVDPSGRFTTSTFIPSGGIDIQITAYDLKGLSTTETVRLERSKRTQTVSRLAAVNPLLGPKQKSSRDRAALIIGLEQYAAAPPADYASRDAQMFADYAREKLGIAPGNIKVLTDTEATRSGLLRALKVWLPQAVQPDKTDLYVFYAGHGMASDDGESAYIVPYGADTFLLEDTAISRERFYEEIGAAKPRTATFFFDNCYAGTTRSEERLLAQRPLSIKVQESPVPDNYLVFTAGESNQTAGVLDEVKHGRFSYFIFKGLEGEADANQDGKISAGELHKYVRESVGRFSAGAQTPTMLGDVGRWVLR